MRGDKLRPLVLWGGRYKKRLKLKKNQLQSFENVFFIFSPLFSSVSDYKTEPFACQKYSSAPVCFFWSGTLLLNLKSLVVYKYVSFSVYCHNFCGISCGLG